jgi:hypothetical protein
VARVRFLHEQLFDGLAFLLNRIGLLDGEIRIALFVCRFRLEVSDGRRFSASGSSTNLSTWAVNSSAEENLRPPEGHLRLVTRE